MARLACIVVPALPHYVTQRGNRWETIFFGDEDSQAYLDLLKAVLVKSGSQVRAWCLIPDHVHLIVVPTDADGLWRSAAEAHHRYSARINAGNRWTGHRWQARLGSVVMDEDHLIRAIACVSLSSCPHRAGQPVRAPAGPAKRRAKEQKGKVAPVCATAVPDSFVYRQRNARVFHSFTETVKSSKSLYSAFLICPDDSV